MCKEKENRDKPVAAYANCPITPDGVKRIFSAIEENKAIISENRTAIESLVAHNAVMTELQGIRSDILDLTKTIGHREGILTELIKWREDHDKISSPESMDVLKVKNTIWMDRFRMTTGMLLLVLVLASTIFVSEMREVNLINGLGFGIGAFIFGENLISRYRNAGPSKT